MRPNLLRNPNLPSGEQTLARWFDTGAFGAPAQFSFGNSPRAGLRGDGIQSVDANNLFNHANFELPGHVSVGLAVELLSAAARDWV